MHIKLTNSRKIQVLCSDDIYGIMQKILLRENKIDRNREHFWTISLDSANKILNIELVSMGSVTQTIVEPMEAFSVPLQKRAVRIILVHNHPSGNLKPSEGDRDVTDRLIQVGRILRTPVLDHLIITEKTYFSFKDVGLLQELEKSTKYMTAYELKRRYQKEALERGNVEGKKEKAIEMAKAMKEEGIAIEIIAKISGLSPTMIKRLKTK